VKFTFAKPIEKFVGDQKVKQIQFEDKVNIFSRAFPDKNYLDKN